MKEQVGGRSVARLAGLDRLSPSLPQWHFVTSSLSFSISSGWYSSFLHLFCRTTHTLQNDNDIDFLLVNSFAHSELHLFSSGIKFNNMDFVLFYKKWYKGKERLHKSSHATSIKPQKEDELTK